MKKLSLLMSTACLFFFTLNTSYAQESIKVGVFLEAPFAFKAQHAYRGISIDLWAKLAENAHINYEFITANKDIKKAFQGLNESKYDVLIGAFSLTPERVEAFEFARPYFISRLSAVTNTEHHVFWSIFKDIMFKKWMFYLYIALSILVLFSFIHAILEEKSRSSTKILRKSVYRIFYKYVLVLVSSNPIEAETTTLTTRLTNLITLLISIIFFSAFLSAMSSAMTISVSNLTYDEGMNNFDDLYNKKVIVIKNSYASVFMKKIDVTKHLLQANSFDQAVDMLLKEEKGILVAKYLQLKDYMKHSHKIKTDPEIMILGASEYAFALRTGSDLLKKINTEMVQMREKQELRPICRKYLEKKDSRDCIS